MISIHKLSKSFRKKPVLDELCLDINSNEITALVGKNGSGKSTLIRLISGLLQPDTGTITLPPNSSTGILLGGDINLYRNLSGYETLQYFAQLHGLDSKAYQSRIDELDSILHFKTFMHEKCNTYSRGMKQKIGLALSIIHNPNILLLDEPSTGLDLDSSNDVIEFLKYLKNQNKTILIATHNIFEISDLSDQIAFLSNGRIFAKFPTIDFFSNCLPQDKNARIMYAIQQGFPNE